jgi:hypothetical protein
MDPQKAPLGQPIEYLLQGCQISIFVFMTGLARVGDRRVLQGILRQQCHEHVAVGVAGFCAPGNFGHMATDTIAEGVDGMGCGAINHSVAHQTLLRPGPFGLELGRWYAQLMDIVAGRARDSFPGVHGLLPVNVLLVVSFGELVGVKVFDVPGGKGG